MVCDVSGRMIGRRIADRRYGRRGLMASIAKRQPCSGAGPRPWPQDGPPRGVVGRPAEIVKGARQAARAAGHGTRNEKNATPPAAAHPDTRTSAFRAACIPTPPASRTGGGSGRCTQVLLLSGSFEEVRVLVIRLFILVNQGLLSD